MYPILHQLLSVSAGGSSRRDLTMLVGMTARALLEAVAPYVMPVLNVALFSRRK